MDAIDAVHMKRFKWTACVDDINVIHIHRHFFMVEASGFKIRHVQRGEKNSKCRCMRDMTLAVMATTLGHEAGGTVHLGARHQAVMQMVG